MSDAREVAVALLPEEWNIVFQGVGQLPYLQVAGLIGKISGGLKMAAEVEKTVAVAAAAADLRELLPKE